MQIERAIARVTSTVLNGGYRRATVYLSPKQVVRCTARFRPDSRRRTGETIVAVTTPNFAERKFIKLARKAGVPFPIRKVQLKEWTKQAA